MPPGRRLRTGGRLVLRLRRGHLRGYRRLAPPPGTAVHLLRFTYGSLQPAGPAALAAGRRTALRTFPTGGSLGTATVVTVLPER
ncbi:hypothetical protein J2S47_006339 [Streptomyces griseoviridis]|uniref:Uncharacterized protein n=1 Tax=Streptomyces griseoviridis TaxID=45398 RepID=A0ABT9LQM3_STRGD|nr:hypothetical protein [Streptomyces griseoviridis]MDP9685837.1 hypothetical protein [Streptomyces griseoviridis]GGS77544.1 hypothetical protein GCM10010240_08240 [Streptomyces griseoviridis]